MADFDEKRDFQRMAIDCVLSFNVSGQEQKFEGNVINLSSKGILFTTDKEFEVGATFEIVLTPINSLTPPMQASAVASRVVEVGTIFEVACEISQIH